MSSSDDLRAKASIFLSHPANLSLLKRVSDVIDSNQQAERDSVLEASNNWERETILREEEEARGKDIEDQEVGFY